MLILILIDVKYSQKAAFSFEKGSNCSIKISSPPPPPPPLSTIQKNLEVVSSISSRQILPKQLKNTEK